MQNYTFIKYFPETKEVVKYFMSEKYNNIEEISLYQKLCQNDPNLLAIKNGKKWFEVYLPKELVIKTNHQQLAELCESLVQSVLPQDGLFAIVHQKSDFSVIWPSDITVEQTYSDLVKEHVSKIHFFY
jgi:hypothetical protein